MSIVKGYSKRNNTTYFYEQDMRWNSELGRPEGTRKLIGKLDPETGKMIPTGKRGRPKKQAQDISPAAVTVVEQDPVLQKQLEEALSRIQELSEENSRQRRLIREYEKRIQSLKNLVQSWDDVA